MKCGWLTCSLAIGIGLLACGPAEPQVEKNLGKQQTCEDPVTLKREFEAAVTAASSCVEDSGCQAVAIVRCPLGCHVAVAKEHVDRILALAKASVDRIPPHCRCLYKCGPLPERAQCVNGSCTLKREP